MSDELEALRAERAIGRVLLECARGIDQRDVASVRRCFHDDARIDQGDFAGDADALLDWLERGWLESDRSWHQAGPPQIEVDPAGGRADAETLLLVVHALPRDADGVTRQRLTGLRWVDRLELRDGRWRIADRRAVVDWSQTLVRAP